MRKLGMILGLLGGFLVMLAILAKFYAPGQLMVTPLDVDSTTRLSGEATLGDDPTFPVKATSITRSNSEKSTDDVVVFVNSQCLVKDVGDVPNCVSADDPQKRLISASVDNFATDRTTAISVNDPKYLPADAEEHEGLVNKWPFEAEKKTYPYWDGTAGAEQEAQFDGEDTIDGFTVYKYRVVVDQAPVELTEGLEGTYSSDKTLSIDPVTGSIIDQTDSQERVDDEGNNFLTLDLSFTDEQVKNNVADARSNGDRLNLIRSVVPLVGFLAGIPALLIGLLLVWRGTRREESYEEA